MSKTPSIYNFPILPKSSKMSKVEIMSKCEISHILTQVGRSFHGTVESKGSNTNATPSCVSPVAMSFLQKKNPPKRTKEIYKILFITIHKYK